MNHLTRIQISRHGIYYLRIQRGGIDRRISLGTRDPIEAAMAASIAHATISRMKIDPSKIKDFTLKTKGDDIEIITDGTPEDATAAESALVAFVHAKHASLRDQLQQRIQDEQPKATMPIVVALVEYDGYLASSKIAIKSQRMAMSTLKNLVNVLGSQFDMAHLTDEIVEDKWLTQRLTQVAETTTKRDLSFIRSFVEWGADKKRKYTPAPLTLSIEAEGESWSYLDANDLKLIFDSLPRHAEAAWQIWIPIIALYSGARVAEITSIKTEYVFEKSGINAVRLAGTKTEASNRDIPLHPDLLRLGFLDYVAARRKARTVMYTKIYVNIYIKYIFHILK